MTQFEEALNAHHFVFESCARTSIARFRYSPYLFIPSYISNAVPMLRLDACVTIHTRWNYATIPRQRGG